GLVEKSSFYADTDPTAPGYYKDTSVQRGDGGATGQTSPVLQHAVTYTSRTVTLGGVSVTLSVASGETVYRNEDGSGGRTLNYTPTGRGGPARPASLQAPSRVVTTAQNGPASAVSATAAYDAWGRTTSVTDADGFVHTAAFDLASGGLTQTV